MGPQALLPLEPERFTNAQRGVLDYLLLGWSNREVAHHLQLSVRTVETHVEALLRRSRTRNRTALVAWWLQSQQ